MDKILHDPKDPKLWELWYIPYYGSCRILSINRNERRSVCPIKGSRWAFFTKTVRNTPSNLQQQEEKNIEPL